MNISKTLFFLFITGTFVTTLFFTNFSENNHYGKGFKSESGMKSPMDTCIPPLFDIIGDHYIKVYEEKKFKTTNTDPSVIFSWGLTNDNISMAKLISSVDDDFAMVDGGNVSGGRFWLYTTGTNNCGSHSDQGSVYILEEDSPVDMRTFSSVSDKNKATLHWETENEKNNSGFDVERKNIESASSEWQKIGFVDGKGTTIFPFKYTFVDPNASSGKYIYRLKQINYDGRISYFETDNNVVTGIPDKFSLSQNYPNPFNPVTKIEFDLPVSGSVKLTVYDNMGREVKSLLNEYREAGHYKELFDGSSLSSGTYFYRMQAGKNVETKKMMLVK